MDSMTMHNPYIQSGNEIHVFCFKESEYFQIYAPKLTSTVEKATFSVLATFTNF